MFLAEWETIFVYFYLFQYGITNSEVSVTDCFITIMVHPETVESLCLPPYCK